MVFTVSGVDVQSADRPPPALPDAVKTKVSSTLDAYLGRASAAPLRSGSHAGDLAPLFTAGALARVAGPDRPTLVDDGLPAATDVRASTSTVKLGALARADDKLEVVAATIDVRLQTSGDSPVAITRTGDPGAAALSDDFRDDAILESH